MKKIILSLLVMSIAGIAQANYVAIIGGENSGATYNVVSSDPSSETGQIVGDGDYVLGKPSDGGGSETSPEPSEPETNSCVGEELTREELRFLIGSGEDYSKACVSTITDFSRLFDGLTVSYDITNWNVSNGTTFQYMFRNAVDFNQDISGWDVSNGQNFSYMFTGAASFNKPLNDWNVSNATNFMNMFQNAASFNQPLDKWIVSKVKYFDYMFEYASSFNQNISVWDVSASRWLPKSFYLGSALNDEDIPEDFR
ncbi:DUF285 domain-containing protein [Vibrio parahaemolyticus]|nr:DUF285 domain-containing protein [Vibrio parahaemolyticus]